MYIIFSILGILITILFVVGTHESAHFLAARLLGIKVLRFSIGFGKAIFRWHDKAGTEYVIAPIPLGGYVKMLDENEGEVSPAEKHLAFNNQPFYKKFIVVAAGPIANLLCAFIIYWLILTIGLVTLKPLIGNVTPRSIAAEAGLKPNQEITSIDEYKTLTWTSVMLRLLVHIGNPYQLTMTTQGINGGESSSHTLDLSNWKMNELKPEPLTSLGIQPYQPEIPLIIGKIAQDSPAAAANFQIGDKLISLNGKPITDWETLIKTIGKNPDKHIKFEVQRQNKNLIIPVQIGTKKSWFSDKTGYLGMAPKINIPPFMLRTIKYSPLEAIPRAWEEMVTFTYFNFLLFGKIITGKLSLQSLGGPITIFESAGDALNSGFFAFLGFLAFLSIAIGVINLLPIPGLDGGHLFFQIIEVIIRRPIPINLLVLFYRLGFILLFLLLFQALMNDVIRLT